MLAIKAAENYLQQEGLIAQMGDYVSRVAKHILIITSPTAWRVTGEAAERSLAEQGIEYSVQFLTGECTLETIQALSRAAHAAGVGAVVGIGGGRVMDTAKGVGETADHLPVITVPTVAATCAAWSPSSVLYNDRGGRVGLINSARAPVWVLVDSRVIADSPPRFLQAGMVDAVAKWYEFSPYLPLGDDALGLLVKTQAAKLSLDIIRRYGTQALADNGRRRVTPALRKAIDAVISLAGLANSVKDNIPRAGIAHEIHDSMTHHREFHSWLHGEKVGFALVVQALLQDPQLEKHRELLGLLVAFGTPITVGQLGIGDNPLLYAHIADGVVIPPDIGELLPYSVSADRIAGAFAATAGIAPGAWASASLTERQAQAVVPASASLTHDQTEVPALRNKTTALGLK